MSTPPRLVELKCPDCAVLTWSIDFDVRGMMLMGLPEIGYEERPYDCPACGCGAAGWTVQRKSPPSFLLQPHSMYPMSGDEFREWESVLALHFPDHPKLRDVQWANTGGADCAARATARHETWLHSEAGRRKHTCPCCGLIAFREPPGSYEECAACRWTDDALALEHATTMQDGVNTVTLEEAQRKYQQTRPPRQGWLRRLFGFGQSESGMERDRQWRPINSHKDRFPVWPGHDADLKPVQDARLYYWRRDTPFVRDLLADGARPGYFDDYMDDVSFGFSLHAMGEPKLGGPERPGDEFRFVLLRSFKQPIAVRIDRSTVYVKVSSGGPLGGSLISSDKREVSQKEFAEFWDRLRAADFWKTPLRLKDQGLDGSFWILEGAGRDGHRVVMRWTPKRDAVNTAFREACEYLLRLAHLDEELDGLS